IAAEEHEPYIRPPLSKGFLAGKESLDAVYAHPTEWYTQNRVEVLTGTKVFGVDSIAHTVALAEGTSLHYDRLLLATGSSPRILTSDGAELAGVHYLRTIDDSNALKTELAKGG